MALLCLMMIFMLFCLFICCIPLLFTQSIERRFWEAMENCRIDLMELLSEISHDHQDHQDHHAEITRAHRRLYYHQNDRPSPSPSPSPSSAVAHRVASPTFPPQIVNPSTIFSSMIRAPLGLVRRSKSLNINWQNAEYQGYTPLHYACHIENAEMVRLILAHPEVNPNKVSIYNGCTPLLVTCAKGCVSLAQILLRDRRVDVNLANAFGFPPIKYAFEYQHLDLVRSLLAFKAEALSPTVVRHELKPFQQQPTTTTAAVVKKALIPEITTLMDLFLKSPTLAKTEARKQLHMGG